MLIVAPGLVQNLPQPALAAIVITASISLVDLQALQRLYTIRKSEFILAVVCGLGRDIGGCGAGYGCGYKDVDTTAVEMLVDLDKELNAGGIHLAFAELKNPVRESIIRYGLGRVIEFTKGG